jgi:hypothetical protein
MHGHISSVPKVKVEVGGGGILSVRSQVYFQKISTDSDEIWDFGSSTKKVLVLFNFSLRRSSISRTLHKAQKGVYRFSHNLLLVQRVVRNETFRSC